MPLFVVERQHPVCMVLDLNRITEPIIGSRRGVMPDDEQIRIAAGLGSVHCLRDPAQRLGHPSSAHYVDEQSPEYRQQGRVAAQ